MSGMGGHQQPNEGKTNVWLTPEWLIRSLGPFELDPCAADPRPFDCAARNLTAHDDGLLQPWHGFVWLNPPYGPHVARWLNRLALHQAGGIALVFARTETAWGQYALSTSDAVFFPDGRFTFLRENGLPGPGNGGAGSMLLAYGEPAVSRLASAHLKGVLLRRARALRVDALPLAETP